MNAGTSMGAVKFTLQEIQRYPAKDQVNMRVAFAALANVFFGQRFEIGVHSTDADRAERLASDLLRGLRP